MKPEQRIKRLTTDLKRNGAREVIEYRDDGYRIYARWVTGSPVNVAPGEEILVCEYKHCDIGHLADVMFDDFFRDAGN